MNGVYGTAIRPDQGGDPRIEPTTPQPTAFSNLYNNDRSLL